MVQNLVAHLTFSWRRSLLCENQSIDLQSKTIDWLLYDRDLRHERVNTDAVSYSEHGLIGTNLYQYCSLKNLFKI